MKTVIERGAQERHSIDKYKFKVLSMGAGREEEASKTSVLVADACEKPEKSETSAPQAAPEPMHAGGEKRDELIESLLKKADEMSSSVIKMQMKLEEAETSCKSRLESVREEAYREGIEAGREALQQEKDSAAREGLSQFSASVQNLEHRAGEFAEALETLREEMVHAAIDIAKEVILAEVGEHPAQIARTMASQLVKELQEASKITLRVNPADHGPVSEAVGALERVEIVSDSAVSRGGVVAISNVGNIDAEVMKRFERIKNAARGG